MAQPSSKNCSVVIGRKPQMRYEGMIKKNCETNEEYVAFLGVPYAKCPEGLDRFQAPESLTLEPDLDEPTPTYEANLTKKQSTQIVGIRLVGSLDCLYLNIFVPKKPELVDELLPVLVFFHGGGFSFGSNDHEVITPDSIIQHGLVFITVNYRLGIHGFLNLHMPECPGNAGLKDQVKALEWIRDNIESFKGDPNNVTISGCSAGGTCVNLHLIAPASQDLFHKAIIQSGGIYFPWGFKGYLHEHKEALSSDRQCWPTLFNEEDSADLYLRATALLYAEHERRNPESFRPVFGPTVESVKEGAFIPEELEKMMKNVVHNKPVIAGITKEEGIHPFAINKSEKYAARIQDDLYFRRLLMDCFGWTAETAGKFVKVIRNKYFPNRSTMSTMDLERCFAKLIRDIYFYRFYDNFKFGPEKTVHKNLYVYRFDHFSEISCVRRENLPRHFQGNATHGDEMKYLFCATNIRRICGKYINEGADQNKEIRQVMNHMCSLWANFCKTGFPKSDFAPDAKWRRHSEEKPCYLSIGKDLVLKEESLFEEDWRWLRNLVGEQSSVESLSAALARMIS